MDVGLGMIVWPVRESSVSSLPACPQARDMKHPQDSSPCWQYAQLSSQFPPLSLSPSSHSFSKTKAGGTSQVFLVRGLVTSFFDIFIVLNRSTSEERGELLAETRDSFSQFAGLLSGSSRQDLGQHAVSLHAGLTCCCTANTSRSGSCFGAYACEWRLGSLWGHDGCCFRSNSCCRRCFDLGLHGGRCSSCWTCLPGLAHGSTCWPHLPWLCLVWPHAHAHAHALSRSWGLLLRAGGCCGTGLPRPGCWCLGLLLELRSLSWSPVSLGTWTALSPWSCRPASGALSPGRAAARPGGAWWLALHVHWPLGLAAWGPVWVPLSGGPLSMMVPRWIPGVVRRVVPSRPWLATPSWRGGSSRWVMAHRWVFGMPLRWPWRPLLIVTWWGRVAARTAMVSVVTGWWVSSSVAILILGPQVLLRRLVIIMVGLFDTVSAPPRWVAAAVVSRTGAWLLKPVRFFLAQMVGFAVWHSTMIIVYNVCIIRFVDVSPGKVPYVVLNIWQRVAGPILAVIVMISTAATVIRVGT